MAWRAKEYFLNFKPKDIVENIQENWKQYCEEFEPQVAESVEEEVEEQVKEVRYKKVIEEKKRGKKSRG